MPNIMKAAVVHRFGDKLQIEDVPVPVPAEGQALIKIEATGVCHTDLHAVDGDWPVKPTLPFIPGHEGAGTVVSLGPGVKHLKEGDRVGIAWLHSACGYCEFCLTGWETLCLKQQNSGYSINGSFAEYALGQADYLARLPDKLSFTDAGPILCAGVTTYKGLKETQARPGEWVVISGVGGLGHVAVQYAKAMGLHVVAVDLGSDKLELASKLVAATGGDMANAGYAILWASAILSAIVDNIPFVATMIPLIKNMAPAFGGPDHIQPLWWCLSLGACLGGNGTLIGASANLTVAGIGDRNGVPFSFITYTLYAFPMMVVSVAICHVYVWWRYF